MKESARFITAEADACDSRLDHLPTLTRLWLVFQAGVTRRTDLLSVSRNSAADRREHVVL